ncbi:PilX N-terminal domain-containing pilus assembly protein [Thermosulfuriphilus sp.]
MCISGVRGNTLVLALVVLLLLTAVVMWASRDALVEIWTSIANRDYYQDFYAAEAGIRLGLNKVSEGLSGQWVAVLPSTSGQISVNYSVTYQGCYEGTVAYRCTNPSSACEEYLVRSWTDSGYTIEAYAQRAVSECP